VQAVIFDVGETLLDESRRSGAEIQSVVDLDCGQITGTARGLRTSST
jgi:hypothetical protein